MSKSLIVFFLLSCHCYGQQAGSFLNGKDQLFYEVFGKGPALYILTGGPGAPPGNPSYRIIDSLKEKYTCVLLHQRGSGRSKNIPVNEHTVTIQKYLEDIELLRRYRRDKSITLLGISWGGLLAMNYAVMNSRYVSRLVLIGSAPPSYKLWNVLTDNQYVRRSASERDSMDALQKIFSTKTGRELDSLKKADPNAKEIVAFKKFIAIHVRAMHYDRSAAVNGFEELFAAFNFQPIPFLDKEVIETKWDITDELKELDIPALILYGRQDDQGESTFYLQKESLKKGEMKVIEKCGHIMWEDQPREFYRILMDYLVRKK